MMINVDAITVLDSISIPNYTTRIDECVSIEEIYNLSEEMFAMLDSGIVDANEGLVSGIIKVITYAIDKLLAISGNVLRVLPFVDASELATASTIRTNRTQYTRFLKYTKYSDIVHTKVVPFPFTISPIETINFLADHYRNINTPVVLEHALKTLGTFSIADQDTSFISAILIKCNVKDYAKRTKSTRKIVRTDRGLSKLVPCGDIYNSMHDVTDTISLLLKSRDVVLSTKKVFKLSNKINSKCESIVKSLEGASKDDIMIFKGLPKAIYAVATLLDTHAVIAKEMHHADNNISKTIRTLI